MKRTPSRWSISCCKARESSSSPSISNHSPFTFCARTFTFAARFTFSRISGRREAALFFVLLAFALDDLRIDEDDLVVGVLLEADVDDGEALREADLRSGEADSLRGVHGLEHLFDQLFSLSSKTVTGSPRFASTGSGYFTISWIFALLCHVQNALNLFE